MSPSPDARIKAVAPFSFALSLSAPALHSSCALEAVWTYLYLKEAL